MTAPARRAISISLPTSDPASAAILAWLSQQPATVDVSARLRALIVAGLEVDRLTRIEQALARIEARIAAGGVAAAPAAGLDAEQDAALDALLDF